LTPRPNEQESVRLRETFMARVHVTSIDAETIRRLQHALETDGHEVFVATSGPRAVAGGPGTSPELIILDVTTSGADRYRTLRRLRETGVEVPLLVIDASATEEDVVRALRLGADDCVTRPLGTNELVARVDALLRRCQRWLRPTAEADQTGVTARVVRFGDVEVSATTRQVWINREPVMLRPRELDLLLALVERGGRVATRPELLREVWGYDPSVTSRTIDIHVAELRRKLEADPAEPKHIITVWKWGYRLQA